MIPATALRRAVSATATRGRPSSFTALSSARSWMLPSSTVTTAEGGRFPQRNFSTTPSQLRGDDGEEEPRQVLVMPPNLKLDSRSAASPFYGLEKITEDLPVVEELPEGTENDDDDDDDSTEEYDYDDDEAEAEGVLYDLANAREPVYAVPLPERLHVPILHLSTETPPPSTTEPTPPEEIGTIHLSSDVFGCDPIRVDILHRCVVYQRNKKRGRRNGGARTKTISEVSGSGRKVRPQKGGGTARAGHSRPPHWRGGAKAHGPRGSVQNYETKLNKKVRRMAVKMALSQKLKEGNLILVDGFHNLGSFKTRVLAKALENIGDIGGRYGCTAYLVDHATEDDNVEEGTVTSVNGIHVNLTVASKNQFKIKVTNQRFMNVYDILKYEKLVMSLSAFQAIEDRMCDDD